ncbi:spore coat protein U domain-containing protein, partial [Staphylococcus aureus]|uniref:spore coat protein U domain-containing protein n=1 Tax=Staphylococcus aureus TaxID=1280 RepID=UPI0038B3B641
IDVTLSPGISGAALARQLRQSGHQLNYNLYTDNARTIVWGDGTGGTSKVSTPLNGLLSFSVSVPVYGRIPARQWVAAGPYSDSVVVT